MGARLKRLLMLFLFILSLNMTLYLLNRVNSGNIGTLHDNFLSADQRIALLRTKDPINHVGDVIPVKHPGIKKSDSVSNSTALLRLKHSACENVSLPSLKDFQYGWKPVSSDKSAYVYSAYHDINRIRIVGATLHARRNTQFHCQLWYHDNATQVTMETVSASVEVIPENHGLKYTAAFFLCSLPNNRVPYGVSLVSGAPCQQPRHMLPVPNANVTKVKYSVCVAPFNFRYARAYELVEWMEMNLLMGVIQFTFYNYSSRGNIHKVLEHYSSRAIVNVLQWDLPMRVDTWPKADYQSEIHYFAQLAFLNDCLYRHVGNTELLALLDLDELIIPRRKTDLTWDDMFSGLPESGAYMFRNTFFRKEWTSPSAQWQEMAQKYKLVTLLKLKRETKIFPTQSRSKLIVRPEDIATLGIHNIWHMNGGARTQHVVSPDVGLLHHYRDWEQPDDKEPRIWDNTTEKFGDKLVQNVENTWHQLSDVTFDIPII